QQVLLGRRDEGRQVRGDARLEQRLAATGVAVGVGAHEVDAAEAVHLEVDEAGDGDAAAAVAAHQAVLGDHTVGDLDVAGHEGAVDERGFDSEPHRSTAAATCPPDCSSRSRAVPASTPASSATTATLALPSASARARSASSSLTPVARRTTRRARAASFSFDERTSIIRPSYVLPSRIIATVEIVFRTSFCDVPALSLVEPATNSGPTTTARSWSACLASSEPSTAVSATVSAPASAAAPSAASA